MPNSIWVQLMPDRWTSRTVTDTPSSCNRRGSSSSQGRGTPRARRAPKVISPLIPAAGSKIAIRMGKSPNINGLAPVQPPRAGVEQYHPLLLAHHAAALQVDGGGQGGAPLRGRVDPFDRLQLPR